MKILLINPNRTYYQGSKGPRLGLPLGILYIAAVLEKNGYQPKIFDCLISEHTKLKVEKDKIIHGTSDEIILETIQKEKPDVVGITNQFSAQIENAIRTADLVKSVNQKIITVMGGPHISVAGKKLLKENKNIDIGVKGEGEYTFLEIVKKIAVNLSYYDIPNIIYCDEDNRIIENEFTGFTPHLSAGPNISSKGAGFIKNLDELPYPAYHLIDMERYLDFLKHGLRTRPSSEPRSISMITSRGCPYNCIFCSIHLHMGRHFRAHSSGYVIEHIKYIVDKYQVKHISFEDDNFTLDINRAKKIFRGIIDNNIKITWDTPNGVRADIFDEELVALMKKSGCRELIFGIESGSQRVLDEIIDKKLKLDKVIRSIQLCQKYKIKTKAFFVIGFPGETASEIKQTKDFALMLYKKYEIDFGLLIATPLLGTRLYQICKGKGYLVKEPDPRSLSIATQTYGKGLIKTEEFDPEYLKNVAEKAEKSRARIRLIKKLWHPSTYWSDLKFFIRHPKKTIKHIIKRVI